ncbi:unnamed protein product [Tetraodon nigroviridis]|uniref:(spotted green pufferfish) hypothetical protein n=1 Tax=Tetraodon nigroviridis TaxID=99883 RepID=Q4T9R8_TETNG|nr:unnamed protein product [Tetraodon nigroviridis]
MAALAVRTAPVGGFGFQNCRRNAHLEAEATKVGYSFPSARKTGTTICGLVFKMAWCSELTPKPLREWWWPTRTAPRSTTSPPIFSE